MDIKAIRKGLRDLKGSIEDFLDNMELDGDEETGKETGHAPAAKKPSDKKSPSDVEEDEDGKKKSH